MLYCSHWRSRSLSRLFRQTRRAALPGLFGKDLRGNNKDKKVGFNIRFLFTVKATPELSDMIEQTRSFLESNENNIGDESGKYPQDACDALNGAITTATQKKRQNRAERRLRRGKGKTEKRSIGSPVQRSQNI